MHSEKTYKNILIILVGTTPQVVTETMYKLMVDRKQPYVITEIHIITTPFGKEKCEEMLEGYGDGAFYRFCRDFRFKPSEIKLKIHVIVDHIIAELNNTHDINTDQSAANYIAKFVRKQAEQENVRIFASLSGGRKTMSVYMGFAMQLYGRPQDKLFHILVQPWQLEHNPDFFYPLPNKDMLTFFDKKGNEFKIAASEIRVELAEIPFVRLRDLMPHHLQDDLLDFTDVVRTTQKIIDDVESIPFITVDLKKKHVYIIAKNRQFSLKLSPREMALYYFLSHNSKLVSAFDKEKSIAADIFKIYRMFYPYLGKNKIMFDRESLQQIRTRINQKIREQISYPIIKNYLQIDTDNHKNTPKYSLLIPPQNVTLSPRWPF